MISDEYFNSNHERTWIKKIQVQNFSRDQYVISYGTWNNIK